MPHEVIMPALGMAQDSGLIVAWHKAAGETVAADDVLFEVETDKATMEVPAGADGVLSQIRREAGADVPVGEVIALIGDGMEVVPDAPADSSAEASPAADSAPPTVAGQDVIMPALGMAQDSGVIVAWHKKAGEAVAADDVLFEVETDKATMEVPAGVDGYVAALYAKAGEEAPVGDVIAVISAEKPENPVETSISARAAPKAPEPAAPKSAEAPPPAKAPEKPATPAKAAPASARIPAVAPAAYDGPILASPKAKRLAAEEGLDLARLAAAGVPMPFHVADLETLRAMPDAQPAAQVAGAAWHSLSARAPKSGFAAFLDGPASGLDNAAIIASFATASLRSARGTGSIAVQVDRPLAGQSRVFRDPDLGPISVALGAPAGEDSPDLIVKDVTGSRITGGAPGAGAVPALTMATDGDEFTLSLDYASGQLDADAAIRLLDGFAGRLEDPLNHLL